MTCNAAHEPESALPAFSVLVAPPDLNPSAEEGPGNAAALLHQVDSMLISLASGGEGGSIDLRHTPLTPADRRTLESVLGHGEVEARVNALGMTHVRDTAVAGVWWVTHFNLQDQVLGEFIQVTHVPDLLATHPDDVHAAVPLLRARISAGLTNPQA